MYSTPSERPRDPLGTTSNKFFFIIVSPSTRSTPATLLFSPRSCRFPGFLPTNITLQTALDPQGTCAMVRQDACLQPYFGVLRTTLINQTLRCIRILLQESALTVSLRRNCVNMSTLIFCSPGNGSMVEHVLSLSRTLELEFCQSLDCPLE